MFLSHATTTSPVTSGCSPRSSAPALTSPGRFVSAGAAWVEPSWVCNPEHACVVCVSGAGDCMTTPCYTSFNVTAVMSMTSFPAAVGMTLSSVVSDHSGHGSLVLVFLSGESVP